jgi:DNA-binding transcriptional LysR family regulator
VQAVTNGELDVAMTALPVEEESGLATLPLFSHPLCVLVPRSGDWLNRILSRRSCSPSIRC